MLGEWPVPRLADGGCGITDFNNGRSTLYCPLPRFLIPFCHYAIAKLTTWACYTLVGQHETSSPWNISLSSSGILFVGLRYLRSHAWRNPGDWLGERATEKWIVVNRNSPVGYIYVHVIYRLLRWGSYVFDAFSFVVFLGLGGRGL